MYIYIYKPAMYGRSHDRVQSAHGEMMRSYSMLLRKSKAENSKGGPKGTRHDR